MVCTKWKGESHQASDSQISTPLLVLGNMHQEYRIAVNIIQYQVHFFACWIVWTTVTQWLMQLSFPHDTM